MAGNFQGDTSGNVLVEFDYNNIVLVDPNKTIDSRGVIQERIVDHEDLVMYANLEAQVLPRTKLALGIQPNNDVSTAMTIAKINFLRPNKDVYMTSGYLDEISGKDSLIGRGQNQKQNKVKVDSQNRPYFESSLVDQQNVSDNGLLGITSINVRLSTSFIPSVTMQLEDIQGRALFQLGDQSPYAAFFNLPYPQFYLTLKGYYGKAIRYQLNLLKFDARFNSSTGNYSISLEFQGFKFNVLNEILVSHLIATPHMYNKRYSVPLDPVVANTTTNDRSLINNASGGKEGTRNTSSESKVTTVQEYVTERGYEKIKEVYSEYKSKGLLPPDFPELTLMQFVYKMDMFEQNVINSYPKVNVEPLTNMKNYQSFLAQYFEQVRGTRPGSWFIDYLDTRPIYLKNGTRIYYFKTEIRENPTSQQAALTSLKNITESNNKRLLENPTLGDGTKDKIQLNDLGYKSILYGQLNLADIDTGKTASSYFNVVIPTPQQASEAIIVIQQLISPQIDVTDLQTTNKPEDPPPYFFVFEGIGRFDNQIREIDSLVQKKLSIYQQAITQDLAEFIQDSTTGIGFNPTVRNVIGVIMANAEAFIRLLDEVHTNAWNVKNDPTRRLVIQNNNKSGGNPEAVNVIQITTQAAQQNQGLATAEQPVYPWPTFFVETPEDKKGRFQLTYLGDKSVVETTKAYDFKIWPEVEFVEEYIKGLNQKDNPPSSQPPLESQLTTFITQFNAIEFPPSQLPYTNKQEIKFLYEIWERQYLTSYYSNFVRATNQRDKLIAMSSSAETQNILLSLGQSNPFLSFSLKTRAPQNEPAYRAFLREISSNGTGELYQKFSRDFFTTPYIIEEIDNPFKILLTTQTGLIPETKVSELALRQMVQGATNTPLIIDTYPFTNPQWVQSGMSLSLQAEGNQVYNTNKSLKVYEDKNVISNFNELFDYTSNRPVTNFSYLDAIQPNLVNVTQGTENEELKNFYRNTVRPKEFIPTVGFISNPDSRNLPKIQVNSILNSPYFINAIQSGVKDEKQRKAHPYVQAAYLFLNSLPLATTRERYKKYNQVDQLDYIASCFNKYGAVHKLPYAWILKVGSVWHRYKNYVDNGIDILSGVWTNFDYVKNYDPLTSNPTKVYKYQEYAGTTTQIVLQKSSTGSLEMNTGFYPNTINDFSYFYNGKDLFLNFSDNELQSAYNDGMLIYNFPNSNVVALEGSLALSLKTWSVLLPSSLRDTYTAPNACIPPPTQQIQSQDYFIIPSFGINLNQTKSQCLSNPNQTTTIPSSTSENIFNNQSVFNGSVRAFWSAPNYGYFNSDILQKPNYDEYVFRLNPLENDISPLFLQSVSGYTKMEEIFGIFDKKALDIMEREFLNYCKPASNSTYKIQNNEISSSLAELDVSLKNFQLFMRNSMKVSLDANNLETMFKDATDFQYNNFRNNVKNFMEYDVILKNGNPSKFNRRVFNSYLNTTGLQDPITFRPYVSGSLPTQGGNVTLLSSKQLYPQAWETLLLEVGFSTIPGLAYSDNGSYITDFFPENNIEFSPRNIILLSQLVKIYATQKLLNPSLNSNTFKTNLRTFLGTENSLLTEIFSPMMGSVKKGITITTEPQDQSIQSQISSKEGKTELYNVFKAVNDKWISGTDYSTKTLFEDILFLDRASRNIGEVIIVDIFAVKNILNSNANLENMSVYGLISSLLMQNNFTVMPLPAYVNFYNVRNVDGTVTPNSEDIQVFGNNLWGTFTTVDYRESAPKMVCFYVGKPSEQLALPRQLSGFGDDGFDLRNPSNPLIENLDGKKDYEYSNKCVGFTVDIGIRNQNVFQNFSVSQDNGKATSESIAAIIAMTDQKNTRNVAAQNASLFNMYKRRSYQCDISCLGNALLQPTMYFNLRHVPMFYGPYMITEVNHVITPGDFTTNFKGVRQGIFDMPSIDSYIQKINQNLLTKIEAQILQQTNQNTSAAISQQAKSTNIIDNTAQYKAAAENACRANLNPQFERYISAPASGTTYPPLQFGNDLRRKLPNNKELQTAIYLLSYVRTYSTIGKLGGNFSCSDFNLANITLDKQLPGAVENFRPLVYSCQQIQVEGSESPYPVAQFVSIDKYIDFMSAILSNRASQILQGQIIQYYCTEFPSSNVSLDYFNQNRASFYERFEAKFASALESANSEAGLTTDFRITPPTPGPQNTQNNPVIPTCPPTTITSITPSDGRTGTIVTMEGTNLEFVRRIEIGGIPPNSWTQVDLRTVQFISTTKIKFSIPTILNLNTPANLNIRVITSGNLQPVVAPVTFTFIP